MFQKLFETFRKWENEALSLTEFTTINGSIFSADQDSAAFPSYEALVAVKHSGTNIKFVYRKGIRRITLQRFLVSKLYYFPGTVTLNEVLIIYENLLWCNSKSLSDPKFKEKFGKSLEVLTNFLKTNRIGKRVENIRKLSIKIKELNLEGFLIPERNLAQTKDQLKDAVYLVQGESGVLNDRLPPRAIIGKGYRDHGCLRNTAYDGSPSWQEVAMAHLDLFPRSS